MSTFPECTSRLRSSDDTVIITTLDTIINIFNNKNRLWISSTCKSSLLLSDDMLIHFNCCLNNNDIKIINNVIFCIGTIIEAYTDSSKIMFKIGIFTNLLNIIKIYYEDILLIFNVCKILNLICEHEKKAGLVLRLQGAFPILLDSLKYIKTLQLDNIDNKHGHSVRALKTIKSLIELLDHALKSDEVKNSAIGSLSANFGNAAILYKLNIIPLMMGLIKNIAPPNVLFVPACSVLEKLSLHEKSSELMVQHNIVNWIMNALETRKLSRASAILALLKLCRNICKFVPKGCVAFIEIGGFDAVLPHLFRELAHPSILKVACSFLWALQKFEFGDSLTSVRSSPVSKMINNIPAPPNLLLNGYLPSRLATFTWPGVLSNISLKGFKDNNSSSPIFFDHNIWNYNCLSAVSVLYSTIYAPLDAELNEDTIFKLLKDSLQSSFVFSTSVSTPPCPRFSSNIIDSFTFSKFNFPHLNTNDSFLIDQFQLFVYCPEIWPENIENQQLSQFLLGLSNLFSSRAVVSVPMVESKNRPKSALKNNDTYELDSLPSMFCKDGRPGIDSNFERDHLHIPTPVNMLCSMMALSHRIKHPYPNSRVIYDTSNSSTNFNSCYLIKSCDAKHQVINSTFKSISISPQNISIKSPLLILPSPKKGRLTPVALIEKTDDLFKQIDTKDVIAPFKPKSKTFNSVNSESMLKFPPLNTSKFLKFPDNEEVEKEVKSAPISPFIMDMVNNMPSPRKKHHKSLNSKSSKTILIPSNSTEEKVKTSRSYAFGSPITFASATKPPIAVLPPINKSTNSKKSTPSEKNINSRRKSFESSVGALYDNSEEFESKNEEFVDDLEGTAETTLESDAGLLLQDSITNLSEYFNSNYLTPQSFDSDIESLEFESKFESGNLQRVIIVGPTEYDLTLAPDYNTNGHTQWFCFRVKHMVAGVRYRFNIVNFEKPASAFNMGMRPMYSKIAEEKSGLGWSRAGDNICYYRNFIKRPNRLSKAEVLKSARGVTPYNSTLCDDDQYFYSLSFSVTFSYSYDTVFISYCYPFTYNFMNKWLGWLISQPQLSYNIRRQPLCFTRGGNLCELLTITEFGNCSALEMRKRPLVILTARVHPGETNASWTIKGVVEFLLSNDPIAVILRKTLVFKIIPMLNPDGVIHGNYRCSLVGGDLNRKWKQPDPNLHPTIYYAKKALSVDRQVLLYCDFHGHSNIKDVVLYGCDEAESSLNDEVGSDDGSGSDEDENEIEKFEPINENKSNENNFGRPINLENNYSWFGMKGKEKVFPALCAKRGPQYFNFDRCTFRVTNAKAGASRVAMWKELNLIHSFTLEASFCGGSAGQFSGTHFDTNDFEEIGRNFSMAIHDLVFADSSYIYSSVSEASRSKKKFHSISSSNNDTKITRKKSGNFTISTNPVPSVSPTLSLGTKKKLKPKIPTLISTK